MAEPVMEKETELLDNFTIAYAKVAEDTINILDKEYKRRSYTKDQMSKTLSQLLANSQNIAMQMARDSILIEEEYSKLKKENLILDKELINVEKQACILGAECEKIKKETIRIEKDTVNVGKQACVIDSECSKIKKETIRIEKDTLRIEKDTEKIEKDTEKIEKDTEKIGEEKRILTNKT